MITHRLGLMCDGAIYELDFSLSKLIASFSCYLLLVLHSKLLPIYSLSSEIHSLLVPEQNHGLEHSLHLMPPQITSIAYISGLFGYNLFCWNWKLKTENWKHCSKIIFKCVNSTVRPIFNEKIVEKWNL